MRASFGGHVDVVQILLEAGADVSAQDKNGKTALMWSAQMGRDEVVRTLLENGADVNAKTKLLAGALMFAAERGCKKTVFSLLEAGADVNINMKDALGWTALKKAESCDHSEVVELLKSYGAKEFVS